MVAITYHTTGAWGAGIGVNLSAPQVDTNFHNLSVAVEDLIANPPVPNDIASITAEGLAYTFHMTDLTTFTVPFPFLSQKMRGEWAASTLWAALDTFTVEGDGVYVVMIPHTGGATFDPDLLIDDEPAYRKEFTFQESAGSTIYHILIPYQGRLSDMARPIVIPALVSFRIPSAGAHIAYISEAPSTANQVLPLLSGATQIGTATFLIGQNIGTIVITTDETFAIGGLFSVGLPAASDATAAGMTLAFAANRVL